LPLHLIKLAVGISDVEQLTPEGRRRRGGDLIVHTKMTPKRADEVMNGGSLYWVVKGIIACRQPIAEIRTVGEGRTSRCEIVLEPACIRVAPLRRGAFQGWRYYDKDITPDLTTFESGELPEAFAEELRAIGAW
jgi:hypothetical protein